MAELDPQLREDKAWSKFARVTKKLSPERRGIHAQKLSREISTINGLKALVEWCASKKIEVLFTNRKCGGGYVGEHKVIYINSKQSLEKQLFVLLHECGHLLIDNNTDNAEFRFKYGYPTSDPNIKRKFVHRCTVIEEEFEAWHRGRKLVAKLGIEIDDEKFSITKAHMLKSYMKWALGDPRFQGDCP